MRRFIFSSCIALVLVLSASARAADTYSVDPVHSMIIFKVSHMGVSNTYGRFNGPTGTITLDADPANAKFDVAVKSANIDTNNAQRDGHLKGPDFFNVQQFPDISFKSTSVKKTDDTTWEVTGDLTLHGVTKSITVPIKKIGEGDMQGKHLVGVETSFDVKCSDYGMTFMSSKGMNDAVTLRVAIEAGK